MRNINSLYARWNKKNGYKVSFMTDDKKAFDAVRNLCEKISDGSSLLELFDANDVMYKMIMAGQSDKRFKLGETIRYTPTEVFKILNGEYVSPGRANEEG